MCGIAGFFERRSATREELLALGQKLGDAIAHRGPDDHGVWADADLGVVLSHRRLSIVDLSPEGHQPMLSASGRYVMVYNGEIYNYPELRQLLESEGRAPAWRGHSDTEVFLAACEAWGIEDSLRRANAMFAIAIFDRQTRQLTLARDRLGEKPLYYGWQGNAFLFGSELKALMAHPAFQRRVDPQAVPLYARFQYVPAPFSIFAGIRKLECAHWVTLDLNDIGAGHLPASRPYWSLPVPQAQSIAPEEARQELDRLLRDAVRIRMHADVPVGAFLSGGIDSSTIAAIAQTQSTRPVRTYSIGFRERDHDESPFARAVAKVIGSEHTELYVSAQDGLDAVPLLPQIYDEPFADSSQIPTYLLARLTRQHVVVSLSGDGGDELFGGYNRYFQAASLMRFAAKMPRALRMGAANLLAAIPGNTWDAMLRLGPKSAAVTLGGDRLAKLAGVMRHDESRAIYKHLVSQWHDVGALVPGIPEVPTLLDEAAPQVSWLDWMMYMDQRTYMPDDILVKVDRATMAVALESRVPFLDPRVVEFAARLPLDLKVGRGEGKLLLKQLLYRYVDRKLFDRPKQGFGIPLAQWLRGPLRDWAEDLLSLSSLGGSPFAPAIVRAAWEAHLSGRQSLHYPIWGVLMYQAWSRHYRI